MSKAWQKLKSLRPWLIALLWVLLFWLTAVGAVPVIVMLFMLAGGLIWLSLPVRMWRYVKHLESDSHATYDLKEMAAYYPEMMLSTLQPTLKNQSLWVRREAFDIYVTALTKLPQPGPKFLNPLHELLAMVRLELNAPDLQTRRSTCRLYCACMQQLALVDSATFAPLLPLLRDPDGEIRQLAADALRKIGTLDAVRELVAVERFDLLVRYPTLVALVPELHDTFVAYLRAHDLADSPRRYPKSHWGAAQQLAAIEAASEPALRALLADPQLDVRHAALLALGPRCTVEDIPALVEILTRAELPFSEEFDRSQKIYKPLLPILVGLKAAAVEPLIGALARVEPSRQKAIYDALGQIGGPLAVEALAKGIGGPDNVQVIGLLAALGDLRGLRWLAEQPARFTDLKIIEAPDLIGIIRTIERLLIEQPSIFSAEDVALLAGMANQTAIWVEEYPSREIPSVIDFGTVRELAQHEQGLRRLIPTGDSVSFSA